MGSLPQAVSEFATELLGKASVASNDLSSVEFIGGGSRIPSLQTAVGQAY